VAGQIVSQEASVRELLRISPIETSEEIMIASNLSVSAWKVLSRLALAPSGYLTGPMNINAYYALVENGAVWNPVGCSTVSIQQRVVDELISSGFIHAKPAGMAGMVAYKISISGRACVSIQTV
jgi:hypothetical protein